MTTVARRVFAGIVVIAALVALAVAWAPATLASWLVERATDRAWTLADAHGTLWSGRATLSDTGGRASIPLHWRVSPLALATGVLAVDLGEGDTPVRGSVRMASDALSLRSVTAIVPAVLITAMLPSVVSVAAGGTLELNAPSLDIAAMPQGEARARWTDARLADARGQAMDLGSVDAAIAARDKLLVASFSNAGGDTALSGELRLGRARVDGDITLAPRGAVSPLLQSIRGFGAAQPGGGVRFSVHLAQ